MVVKLILFTLVDIRNQSTKPSSHSWVFSGFFKKNCLIEISCWGKEEKRSVLISLYFSLYQSISFSIYIYLFCIEIFLCLSLHTHTCTHTHTHTHTHTRTQTHTHILSLSLVYIYVYIYFSQCVIYLFMLKNIYLFNFTLSFS